MSYLMIIDDDEDFATAVATMLCNNGYEVKIELDLKNAEKNMIERQPELIILDIMFPENRNAGFAFARKIRHFNEKLKDIPILLLTAYDEKFAFGFNRDDIDEYWLPGDDIIEKPVDFDVLCQKIEQVKNFA